MKNSISLIGMAGAGKSSVGKELATTLGFRFIDSDALIEKQHGKSLQNILDDEGYVKLREIENIVLKNIQFNETILSTGGSAVYSNEAMEHIQQNFQLYGFQMHTQMMVSEFLHIIAQMLLQAVIL